MQETLKEHICKIVQISNEEYLEIEDFFDNKKYKKDKYIIESGNTSTHEFFIIQGLVAASHINYEGKSHIVQFATEGQWISDVQSFNTGCSTNISIKCLEDTELYCISYQDKEKLCAISRKMEFFFRKRSNANNIMLQNRILLFMCSNSKDRYEQFIRQYPKIHRRLPKVLIAS
ncbi:Crp/Fnr family transcriptional regulator [Flavobacterium saccharophilum]|uniref:cAMP-binding domain of CRP or a regulatory subunit of cAMP-dependent protein kinases n=1 Tax=Flavobacterium saccharophilum TaxID=29534 RepID=A0A1M7FR34_9FLAO|nr:cyclic nucleotide-binding domain-containing protein [Flavobacterium saccharophilum]SHM06524.1 cAMP-binding domain of CRP or a regulatory subunit of cAMP-dependent protein kinases [Flavobacterium saccharophilum]